MFRPGPEPPCGRGQAATGIRTIPVDDPISCATYGAGKMLKHLDEMKDGMMNFYRMRQLR